MRSVLPILLVACLVYMQGCAVGYNRVLFITKSNFGIDFDSTPPTAEISISRIEGVLEPTFESGQTLPVMASFKPESQGLFSGDVAQTFSTGDAAFAMAVLYDQPDYSYEPGTDDWEKRVTQVFDSCVGVGTEPNLPGRLTFVKNDARPVFFGTATSLGVGASWSAMRAALPESLHFGFRRKEIAATPIAYIEEGDTKRLRVPSLLATIDEVVKVEGPTSTRLRWLQYFATGKAATALTLRQDVRKAMLARLDPAQAARFRVENVNLRVLAVVRSIERGLKEFANTGDTTAARLAEQLDNLSSLLPEKYTVAVYAFDPPNLTTDVPKDHQVENNGKFAAIVTYWSNLTESKRHLIGAVGTPNLRCDGVDATPQRLAALQEELAQTDRILDRFQAQVGRRSELTEAIQYFLSKITE